MRNFVAATALLLAASTITAAQDESRGEGQKNEIAVTVAHLFIGSQVVVPGTNAFLSTIDFGDGFSYQGDYARRLFSYDWGAISAEIPIVYSPDVDLHFGQNQIPSQYSAIFVTPAARVNFFQDFPFSPWFSFGGGGARYVASKNLVFSGTNPGPRIKTTDAIEGGFGLDVKIPRVNAFRFRAEVRDFWTGEPPLNINTGHTRQHNYYVGGGAVFSF